MNGQTSFAIDVLHRVISKVRGFICNDVVELAIFCVREDVDVGALQRGVADADVDVFLSTAEWTCRADQIGNPFSGQRDVVTVKRCSIADVDHAISCEHVSDVDGKVRADGECVFVASARQRDVATGDRHTGTHVNGLCNQRDGGGRRQCEAVVDPNGIVLTSRIDAE